MGVEIERKFLVDPEKLAKITQSKYWRKKAKHMVSSFAYFKIQGEDKISQIRVSHVQGKKCKLNAKGNLDHYTRPEWESEIDESTATDIIANAKYVMHRTRHKIKINGLIWNVDELIDKYKGIYLAEIEIPEENFPIIYLPCISVEVTNDPTFYYSNLATTTSAIKIKGIHNKYKHLLELYSDRNYWPEREITDVFEKKKKKEADFDD